MKALLMHPDRDFDPDAHGTPLAADLTHDLALNVLLDAMAGADEFLRGVARAALLTAFENDADIVAYRQAALADCLTNAAAIGELYAITLDAIETRRRGYFGFISRYPSGILHGSVTLLDALVDVLQRLRAVADAQAGQFTSPAFTRLFAMLQHELDDAYLDGVRAHLEALKFRSGVLESAQLGGHNEGTDYVLRERRDEERTWLQRLLHHGRTALVIRIHERDEAGARALSDLRNRGINLVANAAAQSAEHILSFFEMLRTELAFYVSALGLRDRLAALGMPVAFPRLEPPGTRRLHFTGLYDVCLALTLGRGVVGNTTDADGRNAVVITGANQGGKSSFLRSVGLAQLMMQAGLFVGADAFTAERCAGLYTHYTREEDATMTSGKFDQELSRLSDIVDVLAPNAMVLFNESFAATNEREGSEIATQVVTALLEAGVKVLFVTHLYKFAHGLYERRRPDVLFLRAERREDGTRTFRLVPAEPLDTSYGQDLYAAIFGEPTGRS